MHLTWPNQSRRAQAPVWPYSVSVYSCPPRTGGIYGLYHPPQGVYSATAQWYVTRYAGSHHNHQGCITISNLFPFLLLTLRHRWSVYVATPFHPHLTYSIHRNSLDNHGTSQPLRWCRQSEPFIFIEPGSANNNFLRLAAFAQRTRKARLLLTCGAIHLVPPPASCGEERHMADSRLSSRPLAFNLIAQCLFCFPSAFGAERRH